MTTNAQREGHGARFSALARCAARLVALLVVAMLTVHSPPAGADVLVLRNGRTLYGEIEQQTESSISFRFSLQGIWATQTFLRRDIDSIHPEEGDQAAASRTRPEDPPANRDALPQNAPERSRDGGASSVPPGGTLIAVIPLHGQVGGLVDDDIRGTFDAVLLEACLDEAETLGATTVVLDIQSPGGLVSEMEALCDVLIEWQDRMRIVAYPGEAYSAAAIMTMCCPEIIVRPNSLIGAATIIQKNEKGDMSALDAKMASPHYARQRQYMERSGHPYDVVAAMTIQETRLWWSAEHGFTTVDPENATDYREVDDAKSILTMTSNDAVAWRIAKGTATRLDGVPVLLDKLPGPVTFADLTQFVERHQSAADRRLGTVRDLFGDYIQGLGGLNQRMIALFEARGGRYRVSADRIRQLTRDVTRELGKVRSAGRRILRVDQAEIAANIRIPQEFLDRISDDLELLGRVSQLLKSDETLDWKEAAERVGTVVVAWRDILEEDRR